MVSCLIVVAFRHEVALPRYFFDIRDGERLYRDSDGVDLPDVSHVWEVAVPLVDEIAAARLHMESPGSLSVIVRDSSGAVVYRSDHPGQGGGPP